MFAQRGLTASGLADLLEGGAKEWAVAIAELLAGARGKKAIVWVGQNKEETAAKKLQALLRISKALRQK